MSGGANSEAIVLVHTGAMRVGAVQIEPSSCLIRDDAGREEAIEPRIMQVLVALVRAGGAPVSRDELIASCWGGRIVSNDAVTRVISILRKLAKDIGRDSFEVETLNKVGYRLIASMPKSEPAVALQGELPASARITPNRRGMLALGATAGLTLLGTGWLMVRPRTVTRIAADDQTLLVLPATADTGDHDLGRMAQSATNTIRNDLARVPGLRLVGGLISTEIARDGLSAQQINARTKATLALATALERKGASLQLVLTLSDLRSGEQLWSGAIDGAQASPADLVRDASSAVVEQLVLLLPATPASQMDRSPRGDPEAYRLSTEARSLCNDVRELLLAGKGDAAQDLADRARSLVEQALAINAEHADALVVLAQLTRNGWSHTLTARKQTTQQRIDQATGLLRRALRSDPRNAGAMAGLADIYRRFGWRWDDAETLFRHALANDPGNADAHWAYSHELVTLGRARDALDQAFALLAIDRSHLWRRITLPRILYCMGQRETALSAYFREVSALPDNPFLLWEIYYLFAAEGRSDGLSRLSETLENLWSGREKPAAVQTMIVRAGAAIEALAGRPAALLAILDAERTALDSDTLTHATLGGRARDDIGFILAIEYACARQYDRSIALLDRALEAMSVYWVPSLPYGNAPFPAAMRGDPRFLALWQRDPRMADSVQRRRRAAADGQLATIWPDGSTTRPKISAGLRARIEAVLEVLPAKA